MTGTGLVEWREARAVIRAADPGLAARLDAAVPLPTVEEEGVAASAAARAAWSRAEASNSSKDWAAASSAQLRVVYAQKAIFEHLRTY